MIPLALILGAYGFLGNQPVREALSVLGVPPTPGFAGLTLISLFVWLVTWALHSKIMGWILGKEARTAEVYGIGLLVSALPSLLLMPLLLMPVHLQTPLPDVSSLQGSELKETIALYRHDLYAELKRTSIRRVAQAISILVTVWTYFLAYVGLLVMTKNRRKALIGSVLPGTLSTAFN